MTPSPLTLTRRPLMTTPRPDQTVHGLTFDAWLAKVNAACFDRFSVAYSDLPDLLMLWDFYPDYEPAEFIDDVVAHDVVAGDKGRDLADFDL